MLAALRDDIFGLVSPLGTAARRRGVLAFPLTLFCCAVVIVLAALYQLPRDHVFIRRHLLEYGALSWPATLLRLGPSLFAPATALPFWGAIAQVAVCIAGCEVLLGRRTTVTVGLLSHAVATLSARILMALGTSVAVGLSAHYLAQSDSGPSAATTALGVYLALTRRSRVLLGIMLAWPVIEAIVRPGLAEREHVVALATGCLCAGVTSLDRRLRHSSGGRAWSQLRAARRSDGARDPRSAVEPAPDRAAGAPADGLDALLAQPGGVAVIEGLERTHDP